jgi:transposase InsO family protein
MSRAASATGDFKRRYLLARFFLAAVFFLAGFRFFAPFFFTAMLPSRVDDDEDGDANRRRDAGACQTTRRRDKPQIAIRSDNGSRRFRAACKNYRLDQEFITPYTPEQNGIVERFFRSLKEECTWQHNFGSFAEARPAVARLRTK